MTPKLTSSATDASILGIAGFLVPADSREPLSPIHTATFGQANFQPPSRRIAESDMQVRRMNVTSLEQLFKIEESYVRKMHLNLLDGTKPERSSRGSIFMRYAQEPDYCQKAEV